ncbi:AAA family ATPase [Natronosporangium hydrolyticum]|uniref:AAA family ATPase n=1 Tax=Natronosporangium hydrolyticum TaxID=2811111 RepID=A0A895YI65_9ACTN|nr:AAA family ATPase [Natronosporangium hydrolyticum]QSB15219.1 AAA family ATPase [Natronosporangium hydrolyticum]
MRVEVDLLGRFEVRLAGRPVPAQQWPRRHAASMVKLLALAPRRRLHREQVLDALWPETPPAAAGPRLHKAAHFARRVLGPQSVVLQQEQVLLFPEAEVSVDAVRFDDLAAAALRRRDPAEAEAALAAYPGELLPEDRYEAWAASERDRLALAYRDLLRLAGRWQELAELDPTDEAAQLTLMRQLLARGDRRAALRQFERLDRELHRELGVGPGPEVLALRDELVAGSPEPPEQVPAPATLVGREAELARVGRLIDEAAQGRVRAAFVAGPPGVGKSALLAAAREVAARRQWRTGAGTAATVEGAWPYAPVLEALADLCRRHPALLDGLADRYREEIDRALAGRELDWSGEGGHQRLYLAAAELTRLAAGAGGGGALLILDDLHEADEASLRLLHYLVRSCGEERLALLLGHRRAPVTDAFEEVRASLLRRHYAVDLPLSPLTREAAVELAQRSRPAPSESATPTGSPTLAESMLDDIWQISGGIPFTVVELARAGAPEPGAATGQPPGEAPLRMLSPAIRTVLEQVAAVGVSFDTDEFLALAGVPEETAFDHLDAALAALVIERTGPGYRFRHPLIREALLAEVPPHRQRARHRACALRLAELGASPARIGQHLLLAGEPAAAVPYALRAAETAAAVGAYPDALRLVDSVRGHGTDEERPRLAALRADLLAAKGDPAAVPAYREAVELADETGQRELRARLGRMAVLTGDLPTAAAALDGLDLDGDATDATILLARGNLAYFQGELAQAWRATDDAYRLVARGGDDWQVLDLLTLQGLLAHHRGEFLHRLRRDLQRTRDDPGLATAVFDSQLCVVEIMLYGPMSFTEVIEFANDLRATAQRAGALRAVAFATALIGEAALLGGELALAERELTEAVELHRDIAAPAGEAHSLQRLAEVRLAQGDRAEANRLLRRALPLARWSLLALHLLPRIHGTMVRAAADPAEARTVVAQATEANGQLDSCVFCDVMFAVPAAVACADVGELDAARSFLATAERTLAQWEGTAWHAMVSEARAHLAAATGEADEAARLLAEAADGFEAAGQPRDAARCRDRPAAPAGH